MTRSCQNSKGHKCSCVLRFLGGHKSDYKCKVQRMKKYLEQVSKRVGDFQAKFVQIIREKNKQADRLAKVASTEYMLIPNKVLSFVRFSPLIDGDGVQKIGSESNQTTQIVFYLKESILPDCKEAVRKLKVQAAQFILIKDVLYKRGFF